MWLSKKRAPQVHKAEENKQPWLEKMATPLAHLGIKAQQAFAGYMSRSTGKLSLKRLKAVLIVFCLSCGGFSGYLIISSIIEPGGTSSSFGIESLQMPKIIGQDREDSILPNGITDGRLLRRMHAFRQYIDSLRKAAPSLNDSIRLGRHGLFDSLHGAEKMYDAQPLK